MSFHVSKFSHITQVIYICQNFYFWCSGFQKLCFLFFFLQIFPSERARWWCYAGIALSIGYAAGFGFVMTFACWPISGEPINFRVLLRTCSYVVSNLDLLDKREPSCVLHQSKSVLLICRSCKHQFRLDDSTYSDSPAMEVEVDPQEKVSTFINLWRGLHVSIAYLNLLRGSDASDLTQVVL
jgi:hypothetical protein